MYVEAEIFESVGERTRGERSVEETETRMKRFEGRMQEKRRMLTLAGSKDALDIFMRMNVFILDLKRVSVILLSFGLDVHPLTRSSNSRTPRQPARF
jgi:hypothetical protein